MGVDHVKVATKDKSTVVQYINAGIAKKESIHSILAFPNMNTTVCVLSVRKIHSG